MCPAHDLRRKRFCIAATESIHGDLPGLDGFRFGQFERQHALMHLSTDLLRINGRIELEHPAEIRRSGLAIEHGTAEWGIGSAADERETIPLEGDFEVFLGYTWHLGFEGVAVLRLEDVHVG